MAENKTLKEQNELDERVRNEFEKQVLDHTVTKDKIVETDRMNRQMEYRQFLLKQIEDKANEKKTRNSPEIRGNSYVYSEELVAPEMRRDAKLTKQQEMKNGLDECIRMKNELKQGIKQKEIEEERERMDFLKKREDGEEMILAQAKQVTESKELMKEEAAKSWKPTIKEDEHEQFIDSLLKKDSTLSHLEDENVIVNEEIEEENFSAEQQVEIAENGEESTPIEESNTTNEVDRQDD